MCFGEEEARLTRRIVKRRLARGSKDVTRSFRQTVVVSLVLLWVTAGVYRTVCQALCAENDFPQAVAQPSPGRIEHIDFVRSGLSNEPAHSDSQCPATLQPGKCVTVAPQQQVQLEISYAQPLLTEVAPTTLVSATGEGFRTHAPPRFPSGRSICRKLTLLRI